MAGVNYSLTYNDADFQAAINDLIAKSNNLEPVMRSIGEMLLISHDERFNKQESPEGVPWAPHSPTTKKTKNIDKILTYNSDLRGGLNYQTSPQSLLFGTPMEYGAIHHLGGTSAPNSMIPARPWLGVDEDDKEEIFGILRDYLRDL